jgi:nitrite reductase (cytochrome c-552)
MSSTTSWARTRALSSHGQNGKNLVEGMKIENQYEHYQRIGFSDYKHGETGAPMLKAQHPEFELNAYGLHAQSGVSCADCHMPYMRDGNIKVTDHWVRTPLDNINGTCMQCHRGQSEAQIYERVVNIQTKNKELLRAAEKALVSAIDAINACQSRRRHRRPVGRRPSNCSARARSSGTTSPWTTPSVSTRRRSRRGFVGKAIDFARQAEIAGDEAQGRPGCRRRHKRRCSALSTEVT